MFLEKVLKEKKEKVKELKTKYPVRELKNRATRWEKRSFYDCFSKRGVRDVKIIAEVKKASPSMGLLKPHFNLKEIVENYKEGGATALSIITEEKYFLGSLDFLMEARSYTDLPILRKDFIVDEYEIYEARAYGADALLLIAEALERSQIQDYTALAQSLCLDVLIEIHTLKSYEKLLDVKNFLLGINNRDLYSLKVDLETSVEIIKNIPESQVVVIESGIEERKNIEKFVEMGVSNFLVGTSLMLSEHPVKFLKELRGTLP